MKWIIWSLLSMLITTSIMSQASPVSWTFELESKGDGQFKMIAKANIEKGWYVYSNYIEEGGPIPTTLTFNAGIKEASQVMELSDKITSYDELFDMELTRFKKEAIFTQLVKPNTGSKEIAGYLQFMTCDGSRCLPPSKVPFSLPIKS